MIVNHGFICVGEDLGHTPFSKFHIIGQSHYVAEMS